MKKIIAILVALSIALLSGLAAFSESDSAELVSMEGLLLEITEDGGYLIESAEHGEVLVLAGEETYFDISRDILPGDYLYIDYNGQMTRSIPAQITASVIRMYALSGSIVEADSEANTVMLNTDTHGEVLVHLPEVWANAEVDCEYMTVYFNGAMTMSIPAQVGAGFILPGYSLQGAVTEIGEGWLMVGEGLEAIQVNITAGQLPEDAKVGDIIRVIHDGQMTRSIPAQVSASEIIQVSR